MAFTSVDLDTLDRAIAEGVLELRFTDGRLVRYASTTDLLRARAFVASQVTPPAAADPLQVPGGVTFAEWDRR